MQEGVGKGFLETLGERVAFEGHVGDGVFEGGFAFGVGVEGLGPSAQFLALAGGGGGLVAQLGEGKFAAVEPGEGAVLAQIDVEVESGDAQRLLDHGEMAAGTADGFGIVAMEAVPRLGFEFGEGFPGEALDGFKAGEFDEMALAIGAMQDGEAFVVFLFQRNVA
jgi:hypothetical protein